MFRVGVVRLVDLDLVRVVVRGHDRGEPSPLDPLSEAAEPGKQINGDHVVVAEPATPGSWAVHRGGRHVISKPGSGSWGMRLIHSTSTRFRDAWSREGASVRTHLESASS
jgi:hypothetical protein